MLKQQRFWTWRGRLLALAAFTAIVGVVTGVLAQTSTMLVLAPIALTVGYLLGRLTFRADRLKNAGQGDRHLYVYMILGQFVIPEITCRMGPAVYWGTMSVLAIGLSAMAVTGAVLYRGQ